MYLDFILHYNSLHCLDIERNCKEKKNPKKKGDLFPNLAAYQTAVCLHERAEEEKINQRRGKQYFTNSAACYQFIACSDYFFSEAKQASVSAHWMHSVPAEETLLKTQISSSHRKVKIQRAAISLSTDY